MVGIVGKLALTTRVMKNEGACTTDLKILSIGYLVVAECVV